MSSADDYIERVLANLPEATPQRNQIALELRGHIAERVEHGLPLADVLRQLGDPVVLAESYLSAVPLVSAPLGKRVLAKIIDIALVAASVGLVALVVGLLMPRHLAGFVVTALLVASFGFVLFTILSELRSGRTLGKSLTGMRVVRESGTPIGLGQAIVRQLPLVLSIFWIDALFVLFTARKQRAFELLSQTRVVLHQPE